MANFSYSSSALEDTGIVYVVAIENARLAALTPPQGPITAAQYITAVFAALLASYVDQRGQSDVQRMRDAYQTATPAKKAAMVAAALAAAT